MGLTKGLGKRGKDLLGGVNKVYLFPYTKYSRSQITISGQYVTVFPATTVYDYHSTTTNYSESTEVEGGDIAFNQSFTLEFPKTEAVSEIYKLVKQNYRAIYIDYLGNIRILGLWNGLEATFENTTGSDKAGFNGYKINFTGKEDNQAYFIENLSDTGITIYSINNYVFQSGCNYVFQDGNNYIYN